MNWGVRVGPSTETYLLVAKRNVTGAFTRFNSHRLDAETLRIKSQPKFKIPLLAE